MVATNTFTIRSLIRALKRLEPWQTALIRGRHGIGKSQVSYMMAEPENWSLPRVIERRISQLSEGDMIGLPDRGAVRVLREDEKMGFAEVEHIDMHEFDEVAGGWRVTKFLPTDWFLEAMLGPCLIFLDEINRGTPETMQTCFQFVEKGELNGRKIHPRSRIIAAVNYSKEYQVTAMDPAFVNRFWVADLEPDKDDWLAWARGRGQISEQVIDFVVQCNKDHFEVLPEDAAKMADTEVLPSRRSWERFDRHLRTPDAEGQRLLDNPTDGLVFDLGRGFVGPDASRALVKFLETNDYNVSPEDVLDRWDEKLAGRIKRMRPEDQVALIDKIGHHLKSRNIDASDAQGKNLAGLQKALTPEIGFTLWTMMASTSMENAKCFHKWLGKRFFSTLSETKIGASLKKEEEKK